MHHRVLVGSSLLAAACAALWAMPTAAPAQSADREAAPATRPTGTALDFVVRDIDGKAVNLADHKGKVVLIVNVASKCGHTPQYAGLEQLYQQHKDAGLVILGFPANNFGEQEPGTEEEIKAFCSARYNVTFPMMGKVSVKGADKAPLFKYLTEPATAGPFAGEVGWNFTKFLIGRDGKIAARFASKVKPGDAEIADAITKALAAQAGT